MPLATFCCEYWFPDKIFLLMFLSNNITVVIRRIAGQPLHRQQAPYAHPSLHDSKACHFCSDLSSEQQWNSVKQFYSMLVEAWLSPVSSSNIYQFYQYWQRQNKFLIANKSCWKKVMDVVKKGIVFQSILQEKQARKQTNKQKNDFLEHFAT